MIESISAITLATHDMARAVRFYRMLGFEVLYGGDDAAFTSFRAGTSYLNLIAQPAERTWSWWGRVIFYHSDVDALHASVVAAGYRPDTAPRDAEWGERFFHLTDPDGHELSFAKPLGDKRVRGCKSAATVGIGWPHGRVDAPLRRCESSLESPKAARDDRPRSKTATRGNKLPLHRSARRPQGGRAAHHRPRPLQRRFQRR